jgi:RNA polymerase sigma-70 factor (ECF subfamily)
LARLIAYFAGRSGNEDFLLTTDHGRAPSVIGTARDRRRRSWFDRLALPHLNVAYSLARWLTGNEADASDVVQEAYLRAFRDFDSHHGTDAKSWVLKVVRNACYDHLARKRPVASASLESDGELAWSSLADRSLKGRSVTPLDREIEALPVEWRETLVLRELHGLGYRIMSCLQGARSRLLEAIDRAPTETAGSHQRAASGG